MVKIVLIIFGVIIVLEVVKTADWIVDLNLRADEIKITGAYWP